MADTTKKRFYEILGCMADPAIEDRQVTSVWWKYTAYADILLAFSNNEFKVVECLRGKGITVRLTLGEPRSIILATVRYNRDDNNWKERLAGKKDKYCRWLAEWEGDTNAT